MSNPKYLLSRLYSRLIFMPRRLIRATSCRKGWICLACEPRRSSVKPPPFKNTVIAGAPPRTLLFTRVSPEPAAGGNVNHRPSTIRISHAHPTWTHLPATLFSASDISWSNPRPTRSHEVSGKSCLPLDTDRTVGGVLVQPIWKVRKALWRCLGRRRVSFVAEVRRLTSRYPPLLCHHLLRWTCYPTKRDDPQASVPAEDLQLNLVGGKGESPTVGRPW